MKHLATILLALLGVLLLAPVGQARINLKYLRHHHKTTIHLRNYTISGHHVRVVSWRPNRRIRGLVHYSRRARRIPGYAKAGSSTNRAFAAINGGTWHWSTNRPVGTVWAMGRRITRVRGNPAVGFLPGGRVVFGARMARHAGSTNIVSGVAYLIRHGRVLHRFPYAHGVQVTCGAKGTDGPIGCFRSNVVRFRGGRVGLVEISFATMAQAASILKTLRVSGAITMDSGGSSILWTSVGHGGCAERVYGECMGITRALHLPWERQVPDAIVMSVRRRS